MGQHQVIHEKYTNYGGNVAYRCVQLYILALYNLIDYRHRLYISHVSPDAGLSGPKSVVRETTKTFFSTQKPFHFTWNIAFYLRLQG
jgi:hypothetical protein